MTVNAFVKIKTESKSDSGDMGDMNDVAALPDGDFVVAGGRGPVFD